MVSFFQHHDGFWLGKARQVEKTAVGAVFVLSIVVADMSGCRLQNRNAIVWQGFSKFGTAFGKFALGKLWQQLYG